MNEFTIFAHGVGFEVDGFMGRTTLRVDKFWKLGDKKAGGGAFATSGLRINLGDGDVLSFGHQSRIATQFMRENEAELRILRETPGVDTFIVRVQLNNGIEQNMVGFSVCFPPDLMATSLSLGITLDAFVQLMRYPGESEA